MGCFSASLFVINSFVSVSVSVSCYMLLAIIFIINTYLIVCFSLINCIGFCLIIFRISAVLVMIDFHNGICLLLFFFLIDLRLCICKCMYINMYL